MLDTIERQDTGDPWLDVDVRRLVGKWRCGENGEGARAAVKKANQQFGRCMKRKGARTQMIEVMVSDAVLWMRKICVCCVSDVGGWRAKQAFSITGMGSEGTSQRISGIALIRH